MADHWAPGEYRSIWSDLQGVSFSQGYKDANGVRTRYLHSGADDKPVVLFLHGTGGHAEAYCRNIGPQRPHVRTFGAGYLERDYRFRII